MEKLTRCEFDDFCAVVVLIHCEGWIDDEELVLILAAGEEELEDDEVELGPTLDLDDLPQPSREQGPVQSSQANLPDGAANPSVGGYGPLHSRWGRETTDIERYRKNMGIGRIWEICRIVRMIL
jgi:hypothetical protein